MEAKGNQAADTATQQVALSELPKGVAPMLTIQIPRPGMGRISPTPLYSTEDVKWMEEKKQQ